MGEQLVVGPINRGLKTNRPPFYIDNDSFPTLVNAYAWRGRVKRKRGTQLLSRLQRNFESVPQGTFVTLDITGAGNLVTGFLPADQWNAQIIPGTVILVVGGETFTDLVMDGTLAGSLGNAGTINYGTGAISIPAHAGANLTAAFTYYPCLPVMGLEELRFNASLPTYIYSAGTLGFDTTYSYLFDSNTGTNYDVSFYKETGHELKWNGYDYEQFWSCNYQGAFWATNGVPGMHFGKITNITNIAAASVRITIAAHGLHTDDMVFINEVNFGTPVGLDFQLMNAINQQTGTVTYVNANQFDVTFVNPAGFDIVGGTYVAPAPGKFNGIAQYLTSSSKLVGLRNGLRWYDGDPIATAAKYGWVNFAPPLSSINNEYAIDDAPPAHYYLCGAKMVIPFKDRLLFLGAYIQTSATIPGDEIFLQDYVIYSENGTPYYTATYSGAYPFGVNTVFASGLEPDNQVARPMAFWTDQNGYGGFASAGIEQPIKTVNPEKDVLIIGFGTIGQFCQLLYTSNDIFPFAFFNITTEWGASSSFSSVTFDHGAVAFGNYGLIKTGIDGSERIDIDIPDQVFQVRNLDNGPDRVCGQRDYVEEWAYFTYGSNTRKWKFPNQTLFYNYREGSWAIFDECYTTYGIYRKTSGTNWLMLPYQNWNAWTLPWNSGASSAGSPNVIAGNQQGFVMVKNIGISEGTSLYIKSIAGPDVTITSPEHGLNDNDYIIISGCKWLPGPVILNGGVYSVSVVDKDTFIPIILDPITGLPVSVPLLASVYVGCGVITRMYVPKIATKQFPSAWGTGRKTRIGRQNYLFTNTTRGQLTADIFLSTDSSVAYNSGLITPSPSANTGLVYSSVIFTSPEYEIQYVYNALIGTLGNGIALTINYDYNNDFDIDYEIVPQSLSITVKDIVGNTIATFVSNSTVIGGLNQFTVTGTGVTLGSGINYATGAAILVFSAAPLATDQFSTTFQYYMPSIIMPTADNQNQIWHRQNTSLIGDTVQVGFTLSDAQMRDPTLGIQFSEIELHGFIFDISPSSVLA